MLWLWLCTDWRGCSQVCCVMRVNESRVKGSESQCRNIWLTQNVYQWFQLECPPKRNLKDSDWSDLIKWLKTLAAPGWFTLILEMVVKKKLILSVTEAQDQQLLPQKPNPRQRIADWLVDWALVQHNRSSHAFSHNRRLPLNSKAPANLHLMILLLPLQLSLHPSFASPLSLPSWKWCPQVNTGGHTGVTGLLLSSGFIPTFDAWHTEWKWLQEVQTAHRQNVSPLQNDIIWVFSFRSSNVTQYEAFRWCENSVRFLRTLSFCNNLDGCLQKGSSNIIPTV